MRRERCPRCFRTVDYMEAHICVSASVPEAKERPARPTTRYARPSRRRTSRADYIDSVRAAHGTRKCGQRGCPRTECREAANAYMRAWKAKRRASS